MSNIVPFNFENKELRVVADAQGAVWFNANDVCTVLELANSRDAIAKHVEAEDVAKRDTLTAGVVVADDLPSVTHI